MHNSVDIPLFIEIEENGLSLVNEITRKANVYINNPIIVTDRGKSSEYAAIVQREMNISDDKLIYISSNDYEEVRRVETFARKQKCDFIIGVGGGMALDISKMTAYTYGGHFISIPTLPSHDGISSPVASIKINKERKSMPAGMPMGIIVDLNVMCDVPKRFLHSGIMDIISNFSAIKDWELAYNMGYEMNFNGFANAIAYSVADNVLNYPYDDVYSKEFLHIFINALVLSGIAMEITGSSRPASGAEHNFSHSYDMLYPDNTLLHGEKVGIGTLIVSKLRSADDFAKIKSCFERYNLIESLKERGLEKDSVIKAMLGAKTFRPGRYTLLTDMELDYSTIENIYDELF